MIGVFDSEEDAALEFNSSALKYGRPEIMNVIKASDSNQTMSNRSMSTLTTQEDEDDLNMHEGNVIILISYHVMGLITFIVIRCQL